MAGEQSAAGGLTDAEREGGPAADRILAALPMDAWGHVISCGYDDNDEHCDCSTLRARLEAIVAARVADAYQQGCADGWDEGWYVRCHTLAAKNPYSSRKVDQYVGPERSYRFQENASLRQALQGAVEQSAQRPAHEKRKMPSIEAALAADST